MFVLKATPAFVVAGSLLLTSHAQAQSTSLPILKIAPLGTNTFSLTVTKGISGTNYDILWTPVLNDALNYPWTSVATGNPGQTNFMIKMSAYQVGFFAADTMPSWQVETNSGIVAWWRANQIGLSNGAVITKWMDRYGNVLQGNAIFDTFGMNGYNAVDFNRSANNALSNSVVLPNHPSLTNCGSIFIMFAWAHPSVLPGFELIFNCSINNNATYFVLSPTGVTSSGMDFLEDGWLINNSSGAGGNITFDSNTNDDEHLFIMTWTNGVWQDYLDGKLVNNYPNGAYWPSPPVFPVGMMGLLTIGNNFNDTCPLQGSISEIGIATNWWNFRTVDQAANYILMASDMLRPTIVLHGDSMIWGGTPSYLGGLVDYLSTNLPGWTIDDCGIPGATSTGVLSNFLYMANYSTASKNKIDFFWDNLNNDGQGISFLKGITNNLYRGASVALANGEVPILVIPPSNPLTDTNRERFVFENTMTNNPEAFQFLCNLSLNSNVGYSNAWTNGTYYAVIGGPHFTNAGNATITPQFISTIERIPPH